MSSGSRAAAAPSTRGLMLVGAMPDKGRSSDVAAGLRADGLGATGPRADARAGARVNGPEGARLDARVERSRRRLRQALTELALAQGYEQVTIRDITARAAVGYATFFRHYPDKDALLFDLLDELLADLMARLEPGAGEVGRVVFEHVRLNTDLYRVLLASQRSVDLLPRALEVGMAGVLRSFRQKPLSAVPFEAAVNHLIHSFVALIAWWLETGARQTPAEMGDVFEELIMRPTREAAFEPR